MDPVHGRASPAITALEKFLLILLAVLVLTVIILSICLVDTQQSNSRLKNSRSRSGDKGGSGDESNVCVTQSCISEASDLLRSMNMSVDPCTDFYSFVCGNWIKDHHLVSSVNSQFTKLSMNIFFRVKEILEDLSEEKNLPENKKKASHFFQSCVNEVERNLIGSSELLSDLRKFGGWPLIDSMWNESNFDWAELTVKLFKNGYMSNMFFTPRVSIDVMNTTQTLLSIGLPSFGLDSATYYSTLFEDVMASYKNVILLLAKHLKPDINETLAQLDIEEAVGIEKQLAAMVFALSTEQPGPKYHVMTLEKLANVAPQIPWKRLFTDLLPSGTQVTDKERVQVPSPNMITMLNSIISNVTSGPTSGTKYRGIANYMFYRVVLNAANFLSREYYILVGQLKGPGAASPEPWQVCLDVTMELFQLPLTSSYVKKFSGERTKKLLEEMYEDLRKSLSESIKNADWLDKETRNYALLKVKEMGAAIAYEDEMMVESNLDLYYKSVTMTDDYFGNIKQMIGFRLRKSMEGLHQPRTRSRWTDVLNLLVANAFYRPEDNSIIIPVGVLQEAIFATERPNYINYGSLGSIVGHELNHAFDSTGSLYDAEGNYRNWWTLRSLERFELKMACYINQYNQYRMPDTNSTVNGLLTLGENIADNGGVQVSYYAYLEHLRRSGSEKSLPGLPFDERQMFWIAYGSVWCGIQTREYDKVSLKYNVHTPSRFRVIGTLSNMKEFSEDFSCKSRSRMNPESKCSLWK